MKFLLIFILTLTILNGSESIELECKYRPAGFSHEYDCSVQNSVLITSKNDREISEVQGQHLEEKNNDDVKGFDSSFKTINFFPRGLTKVFKNIDSVWIHKGGLKEISKDDLEQFGEKLTELKLGYNELKVIEGDLFVFTPNLIWLDLKNNKIVHIDSGAFGGLENLGFLFLDDNPCTLTMQTTDADPKPVAREVEKSCKDLNRVTTESTST
jgi:hypothetical protein